MSIPQPTQDQPACSAGEHVVKTSSATGCSGTEIWRASCCLVRTNLHPQHKFIHSTAHTVPELQS